MKSFKKVMAGMLMGIMVIGMLTGCGGDPVADDFEKFLNTDMVDVNANYDKIKEESAKWGDLETNEEIKDSINNGIMPNIDDSLDKLSKIKPETDEVKAIKEKYVKAMEAYKEGYTKMLEACDTNDEQTVTEATQKIDEGIKLLDDYNNALESLAKEKDMKIEY